MSTACSFIKNKHPCFLRFLCSFCIFIAGIYKFLSYIDSKLRRSWRASRQHTHTHTHTNKGALVSNILHYPHVSHTVGTGPIFGVKNASRIAIFHHRTKAWLCAMERVHCYVPKGKPLTCNQLNQTRKLSDAVCLYW